MVCRFLMWSLILKLMAFPQTFTKRLVLFERKTPWTKSISDLLVLKIIRFVSKVLFSIKTYFRDFYQEYFYVTSSPECSIWHGHFYVRIDCLDTKCFELVQDYKWNNIGNNFVFLCQNLLYPTMRVIAIMSGC